MNSDFITKMKYRIKSTRETLKKESITNFQAKISDRILWEF